MSTAKWRSRPDRGPGRSADRPGAPNAPHKKPKPGATAAPHDTPRSSAESEPRHKPKAGPAGAPHHRPRQGPRPGPGPGLAGASVQIYGLHAARAALANPRRQILAAHASAAAAERLAPDLAQRGIVAAIEAADRLARRVGPDAVHQGIVLDARPLEPVGLADIAPGRPLLAVDQVTDPRNLGAILRVAAAYAVAGLILTRRHRPPESGVLARAASGGLEHVPIVEAANLARTLAAARDAGYWLAGLDSDGPAEFATVAGERPLLIVLGSEGEGLRRLTRETCDGLYRIALPGVVTSLNVATACAIALQIAEAARPAS